MANERFDPQISSDKVWRDDDMERCISDDLAALESRASALETGKAASNHTHTPASIGAAAASHGHSDKADLVDGKVPASQLPGYVDDVLEYAALANFPATGEAGKIYVATGTNKSYRWSGSGYVEIAGGVALGETSATAYRGDRGKTAYDHSQNGNVHVTAAQKQAWDGKADGNHTHSGYAVSSHTHDYAASNHTHANYFPKAGGEITGETNFSGGLVRTKGDQTLYNNGTQVIFGTNNKPHRIAGSAITATKTIQVDSDARLKENVSPVDAEACRKLIEGIDVKTFNYIGQNDPCMGVIAQELLGAELSKFFVSTGPEGYLSVKEAGMVWPLLVVVQQLCREIADLKAGK